MAERFDLRQVDWRDLFPWTLLFQGFRLARDPKKIALGAAGALLMTLGWYFIGSFATDREPSPPDPLSATATAEERQDYQRQLNAFEEESLRHRLLSEVREPLWRPGGDWPKGVYVSPFDREKGWTSVGVDVPGSMFLVFEPIRSLLLPARLTFQAKGSAGMGLPILLWTLAVWSFFGAAICRISAVQIARNSQVSLIESLRFAGSRYISFFASPILPFLGVILIVLFCVLGALLLHIPGVNVLGGVLWILPLLAGFVMVAALLGLALGWPLMFAAIGAEATESFDALSRAFSYVLGRPWHYFFYAALALLYGGLVMIFVTIFAYATVHLSQYAVSWGYGDARMLYAFIPEAPGWRDAFGPTAAGGSIVAPTGAQYLTALFVGFWTHALFLGIVGFVYSFFWTEATAIYFLLRRDVDETELEEVYLEEEDEEPFPTATPTVAPPKGPPSSPAGPGASLPIIEPPRS